jgi:hypothetical protein
MRKRVATPQAEFERLYRWKLMKVAEEDNLLAAKRELVITRVLEQEIQTFEELILNH